MRIPQTPSVRPYAWNVKSVRGQRLVHNGMTHQEPCGSISHTGLCATAVEQSGYSATRTTCEIHVIRRGSALDDDGADVPVGCLCAPGVREDKAASACSAAVDIPSHSFSRLAAGEPNLFGDVAGPSTMCGALIFDIRRYTFIVRFWPCLWFFCTAFCRGLSPVGIVIRLDMGLCPSYACSEALIHSVWPLVTGLGTEFFVDFFDTYLVPRYLVVLFPNMISFYGLKADF